MGTWTARNDARVGIAGRTLAVIAFALWLVGAAQAIGWMDVAASVLGAVCLALMLWITVRHIRTYRGQRGGASLLAAWIVAALFVGFVTFVWVMEGGRSDEGGLAGLVTIVSSPLLYSLPTWLASSGLLYDARGRRGARGGPATSPA
jgi:hypothetical protein